MSLLIRNEATELVILFFGGGFFRSKFVHDVIQAERLLSRKLGPYATVDHVARTPVLLIIFS